jgi:hypothetical protein
VKIGNTEYSLSVVKKMTKAEFLKWSKSAYAEQHADLLPLKKDATKLVKKKEVEE